MNIQHKYYYILTPEQHFKLFVQMMHSTSSTSIANYQTYLKDRFKAKHIVECEIDGVYRTAVIFTNQQDLNWLLLQI